MEKRQTSLLIIDDERQIRDTYGNFFKNHGFVVDQAADGEKGLRKLRQETFDVAIFDTHLPKINGIELARIVAEEGIDTSLIVLTGHGDKEDAVQALNLGVEAWFEKATVKPDELLQKVTELAQGIPLDEVRRILSAIPNGVR